MDYLATSDRYPATRRWHNSRDEALRWCAEQHASEAVNTASGAGSYRVIYQPTGKTVAVYPER